MEQWTASKLGKEYIKAVYCHIVCLTYMQSTSNGNPLQCSCLENPRTEEPGGLLSVGLHRVGHDWSDLAAAAAEYIMRKAGLDEAQAGIKIAGRNINNLRYADDITFMAESKEELKSLLMKVNEESEKVGLSSTFRKQRSWHLVPSLHGK